MVNAMAREFVEAYQQQGARYPRPSPPSNRRAGAPDADVAAVVDDTGILPGRRSRHRPTNVITGA